MYRWLSRTFGRNYFERGQLSVACIWNSFRADTCIKYRWKVKWNKKLHPNAHIIGIDACLGNEEDIGDIRVRNHAISPGKGVGKELPEVGETSIIGIVDTSKYSDLFFSRSIRLSFVMDMAKSISKILFDSCLINKKELVS